MLKIDLNCDLGESFGAYKCGMDEEVLPHISSANVACGFHASDPMVMDATVALAAAQGVAVGAHPGYPDLVGFGRRSMSVSPAELKAMTQYQIGALEAFCRAHGVRMQHVKPHGAMYNMAARDMKLSRAICEGVAAVNPGLILLGLSGRRGGGGRAALRARGIRRPGLRGGRLAGGARQAGRDDRQRGRGHPSRDTHGAGGPRARDKRARHRCACRLGMPARRRSARGGVCPAHKRGVARRGHCGSAA